MNDLDRQRLVQDYLDRLSRELADVPASARRELLEDVRSHVEEAWAASADRSQAALLNILERLGSPEALAREERERLGQTEPPAAQGPGVLEVAAIVLTLLGALTFLAWPVGVLLAWLSPRWLTRDKIVATLIPALGLLVAVSIMAIGYTSFSSAPTVARVVVQEQPAAGQSQPTEHAATPPASPAVGTSPRPGGVGQVVAGALAFAGMLGGPIITAVYLALRLRPRPRPARTVAVAVAVVLALCVAVALLLIPASYAMGGQSGQPHVASTAVAPGPVH